LRLSTLTDKIGFHVSSLEGMRYDPTMPNKRFIPLLTVAAALPLVAWAQAPSQVPPQAGATPAPAAEEKDAPPTPAELVVDEAIKTLQARESAAAEVLMQADMLGLRFKIVGEYLKAPGYRVKLRLAVEGLGDTSGVLQQISDGTTVWEFLQVLEQPSLRTFKLEPVLKALDNPDADPEFRRQVIAEMGFAGPEALLQGLRRTARLDQQEEGELDGKPVWIIRGEWNAREGMTLPGQNPSGLLPSFVPSHVTLYLGKDDGWPYRVLLEGRLPSFMRDQILDPSGRPIGRKSALTKERPTRLALRYTLSDRPIDPAEFAFEVPPNIPVQDDTEIRAAALEAAIEKQAALKRSQGTGGGDALDQSLPVPRPDGPNQPAPAPGQAPAPDASAPR
jgi:hypothetical protein